MQHRRLLSRYESSSCRDIARITQSSKYPQCRDNLAKTTAGTVTIHFERV
jgi:hypothetical protein